MTKMKMMKRKMRDSEEDRDGERISRKTMGNNEKASKNK
jgi:hypothetical protein